MNIPFLDLKAATAPMVAELQAAAARVIAGGRYLRGEETAALEREIAALCGVEHCVAVSNGLDALRLVLRAWLELGKLHPGDKVAVQANTYVASVLAITDMGLRPVLCEPDAETMNLSGTGLRQALEHHPDIKAVMPVHLYGTPCWDNEMLHLVTGHHLLVLEDNAQAIAAVAATGGINGTRTTGGLGHAGACSFYPTKNLGALGDAGAVTTGDAELAEAVRALANYGSDRRYHNIYRGYNCRIDELQAAMLRVKLRWLDHETQRRIDIADCYDRHISSPLVTTPAIIAGARQVWHQYVIRVRDNRREAFCAYMRDHGIGTDIHYATPPHRQPCYHEQYGGLTLPVTEQLAREVVSLPVAAPLTTEQAQAIATVINTFGG